MGVGTPEEIVHYVAMGVDMMDCVLPTRAARNGLLFTSEGRLTIKNARYATDDGPLDPNCACQVARVTHGPISGTCTPPMNCSRRSNTVHNLAYYLDTMRKVRQAISLGEFASLLFLASGHRIYNPNPRKSGAVSGTPES